ncbi:MAG: hypothetical protein QY318_00455 [Candidatus Dojkabacteria bacterium]|nr:MAG: hypothetical protein QY318_00455 [Candidatus Dojkabacteria bacterium]
MTFIKMHSDFVSLEELAELSELSTLQIEQCVDKGLLDNDEVVNKYFPEYILTVRKLRLVLKVLRANLSRDKQKRLLNSADIFDAAVATDENIQLMLQEFE